MTLDHTSHFSSISLYAQESILIFHKRSDIEPDLQRAVSNFDDSSYDENRILFDFQWCYLHALLLLRAEARIILTFVWLQLTYEYGERVKLFLIHNLDLCPCVEDDLHLTQPHATKHTKKTYYASVKHQDSVYSLTRLVPSV